MSDCNISVVISTRNPDKYKLKQALDSIENQTVKPYEILLVDDASSHALSFDDVSGISNIRIIRLEESYGLAYALNKGISEATGNIIARMDDDDISLQERFERQLELLNQGVDCCFTAIEAFGDGFEYTQSIIHKKMTNKRIKKYLEIKGNPFCHSSAMFRKKVFEDVGGYNEKILFSQDYDLWLRLSNICIMGYLEEILVRWRFAGNKKSKEKEALQTSFCEYSRYYAFLNSKQNVVDIIRLLFSYIYLFLQIVFVKRRQFDE